MRQEQRVKKAQFSAGDLAVAYIMLLYGRFNI